MGTSEIEWTDRVMNELLWLNIEKISTCWIWKGPLSVDGYGIYKNKRVHRLIYEEFCKPIPSNLHLHHLCRNRRCVNPAHMKLVSRSEHVFLDDTLMALKAKQTHCKWGHPLSGKNLIVTKKGKGRGCKICKSIYRKKHKRQPLPKSSWHVIRGEQHHWSKLSEEQIIKIRELIATNNISQTEIGNQFGVSQNTISAIKHRTNWKHI